MRNETTHQCPVKTGELKVCDQFRCWVCNEHFYNLEQERGSAVQSEREKVLDEWEKWRQSACGEMTPGVYLEAGARIKLLREQGKEREK
jgi:hypothetical protein